MDGSNGKRIFSKEAAERGQIDPFELDGPVRAAPPSVSQAVEWTQLPTDRPRSSAGSRTGESVRFSLTPDQVARLNALAEKLHVSLFVICLSSWVATFARFSGQEQICIGVARRHSDADGRPILGYLEAIAPVRLHVPAGITVLQLISQTESAIEPSAAHLPFPNEPVPGEMAALSLSLHESQQAMEGVVVYDGCLFEQATIERMIGSWSVLCEAICCSDLHSPIWQLPILNAADRRLLESQFNDTTVPLARELLIHEMFEEQVARSPDAIAIVCEGRSLTYAELNSRANRLARRLRESGVVTDQLVGLCAGRRAYLLVGLLGILKAGGAYVPLDPQYPRERLEYMLSDANPRIVLTEAALQGAFLPLVEVVIALDADSPTSGADETSNLDPRVSLSHASPLAYVIYTSGSTGRPKGVMVEHRGVVNLLTAMQRSLAVRDTDCLLAVTTISFDIAALELFLPLISGAKVVLASREDAVDAAKLVELIDAYAVSLVQATPATWKLLIGAGWAGRSQLKALCGGEALTTDLARELVGRVGALWNVYGPTETTIWSCSHRIERIDERSSIQSIGRPIANTQVHVLDRLGAHVPVGVFGEICIGGRGVARGYRNQPDLTAARLIPEQDTNSSARLYKTGDIGRWRADGTLEYLGRNDQQVKVRGFRIELGEIEARLRSYPKVKDAVVVAREDGVGGKRLVAYLTLSDLLSSAHVEDVRAHLRAALPDYMVPSAFAILAELPLTPNGKIDRRSLPEVSSDALSRAHYEAPCNEHERFLASIWQRLLQIDKVGRHDDFFSLGGHSLLVAEALTQLSANGFSADMSSLVAAPTLSAMASALRRELKPPAQIPPNLIPVGCSVITPHMLPLISLTQEQIDRIVDSVPGGAANVRIVSPPDRVPGRVVVPSPAS